jgi:hypothetical protein
MQLQTLRYVGAGILALASVCGAQPQCSQQTIRGTWVDVTRGTLFLTLPGATQATPAPMVGLGVFTIDHQGGFTARATSSVGGQITKGTIRGSFQVNSDCTATATFTIQMDGAPAALPGTGTEKLFISRAGNEMHSIPVKGVLGKSAALETLRRISPGDPQCSSDTVRGAYGGHWEGIVLMDVPGQAQPAPVPAVFIGSAAIDPQGRVTGSYTISLGGEVMEVNVVNSTIQVNPDCTGTLRFTLQPDNSPQPLPVQLIEEIVVLDNGDELVGITTQGLLGKPTIGLSGMKRLSMLPVQPVWQIPLARSVAP